MPDTSHAHHHGPGQPHPPVAIAPSLLRMGALQRLLWAALAIALIWAGVLWAMS